MSEKTGFSDLMAPIEGFIFHPLTLGLCGFAIVCAILVFVMSTIKTGKSNPLKFSETPWLNVIDWFSIFFAPILALIFVSILAMLTKIGFRILSGDTVGILRQDNLRWYVLSFVGLLTALGGIIGTPLALIRVHTTERQTKTAEQGHITDRINKAVEGLGSNKNVRRPLCNQFGNPIHKEIETPTQNGTTTLGKIGGSNAGWLNASEKQTRATNEPLYEEITIPNIEVRIGAIYSLERIAQDSLRDHVQIMEILCTYIRENSPARAAINIARPTLFNFQENSMEATIPNLRTDIATALTVIGRRTPAQKEIETIHPRGLLSLHGCNLQRIEGRDLDFSGIYFSGSWLSLSLLYDCDFTGCHFENSTLDGGAMIRCMMDDINAPQAVFNGRMLPGTTFRGAYLFDANFDASQIDQNPNYGGPTDFSYANIVKVNWAGVDRYQELRDDDLVYKTGEESKTDLEQNPFFEKQTKDSWTMWKEELGYIPKNAKQ